MSKLSELIQELCPDGVEYKPLEELCSITTGKLNANAKNENGLYPFFTCDAEPYKINEYAFDTTAIIISGNGSQVGHINFYSGKFNAYQRTYILDSFRDVSEKFLLHFLKAYLKPYVIKNSKKGSVPYITLPMLGSFKIPIPPLEVQQEIVRILDSFLELTTELTIELTARKQQFEYYRDELLLDLQNGSSILLGDATTSISSGKNKERLNEGQFPVYGSTGIIARTNTSAYNHRQILIARVGANAGYTQIADGQYDVSDNTLIVDIKPEYNLKYFYYLLTCMNLNQYAKGGGQPLITASQIKNLVVKVPSFQIQQEIVEILDKFETICSDITNGLPAEIDARQKQYEYYRNKLLGFKEIS